MPRLVQKPLTVRGVAAERRPGYYCDGFGLYLAVGESSKSWVFRYRFAGKRHDMGLGSVRDVPLVEARDTVNTLRRDIRQGIDPLARRREQRVALRPARKIKSVEQCVHEFAREQMKGRKLETVKIFISGLESRVFPTLGKRDIASITCDDVAEVFRPIWGGAGAFQTKLALSNLSRVCIWAKANKLRGDNPAAWDELKLRLPTMGDRTTKSRPSLDWRNIGKFMVELRRHDGMPYRALEMVILTGCRTDEVREMTWGEINRETKVWTIPPLRMKAKRAHLVPLTSFMLDVLNRMEAIRQNDWVFPGLVARPIHVKAIYKAAKEIAVAAEIDPATVTPHGFRSTIYSWMREGTWEQVEGYTEALVDITLAHAVDDKVRRAYDRAGMLDKRREFLEHWGRVCGSATSGVVVPLKA
jgi:integrase